MKNSTAKMGLLAIVIVALLTTLIMPSTSEARCRRWQWVNGSKPTTLYRGVTYWIRSSRSRRITVYDSNGYFIGRAWRSKIRVKPRWTGTFWVYGYTNMRICW